MKITRVAGALSGAAVLFAAVPLAPASAINNIKGFGVQMTLKDYYSLSNFSSEIGYTVKNLRPSRDPVPYPVAGRLFEANTVSDAVVGTVFPQPGSFLARTANGADYRSLPVSTLSGAPIGQGGETAGKLYFDVVGEDPDSVIFNAQFQDLLGWVGQQPVEPDAVVPGTTADGSGGAPGSPGNTGFQGSPGAFGVTPPPDAGTAPGSNTQANANPTAPVGGALNRPNQNIVPPVVGGTQTGNNA